MKRKTLNQTAINFFIFTLLVIVFCFQGPNAYGLDLTAAQKEVWKAVEAGYALLKKGDLEGVMSMQHDKVIIWWDSRAIPLRKEAIKLAYKGWFEYDKPIAYELKPLQIHIIGNVASVFYRYKWNGNVLSVRGRAMETWIKQDNKWLIIGGLGASCDKLPICIPID